MRRGAIEVQARVQQRAREGIRFVSCTAQELRLKFKP